MSRIAIALWLILASTAVRAQTRDLVDDFSRGDLLRFAMSLGPDARAVPDKFVFPADASSRSQWIFGTDVSHHDGKVDWSKARKQGIRFVYLKATQGLQLKDNTFAAHWSEVGKLSGDETTRIYRGAYHFLSAEGDAKAQAQNFLANSAPLLAADLPPTVDLEWDAPPGSKNPGSDDRWKALRADQIIEKVEAWMQVVQQATGRTPIIYTAASWWSERMGKTDRLAKYQIWTADYSRKSQLSETPILVPGYQSPLWQFSESGRASEGFSTNIDVNVYKGTTEQFLTALKVGK